MTDEITPDIEVEDEELPVRTTRHDVPIQESLATGPGQHKPVDPDEVGEDRRVRS